MPSPTTPRLLTITSGHLRLAALLFLPAAAPRGALLVCHGAGSCKENHAIMGKQAAAAGLAALVFDFRGHGASEGIMDAGAGEDVVAAAEALRAAAKPPWLAARGSSLGAYWLLRVAHGRPVLFQRLALLCPADEASLLRGLDHFSGRTDPPQRAAATGERSPHDRALPARFDPPSLRNLWEASDVVSAAAGMTGVLLAHARDDPDVPFAVSERLYRVLAPPKRLIALPSGGHKAPQRSARVAQATLRWAQRLA